MKILHQLIIKITSIATKTVSPFTAVWTFPSVLFSAIIISWAAEAAQFLMSQGMALAILAWLQTLPEFAVEAVISWEAGKDPGKLHLVTANFTGSLRLLVGLGWPMIYITAAFFHRKKKKTPLKEIHLTEEHCVEVNGLLPPILYFLIIYYKSTLTIIDSIILFAMYFIYLAILNRIPPQEKEKIEELPIIPKKILSFSPAMQKTCIISLFLSGGIILYFVAKPFLHSMLALAITFGISDFVFVQWLSPFLSEFPEKVSAFKWARTIKEAPMALMNMVSSNINQWTMLVAMIPIVYSISTKSLNPIVFDEHQRTEIILTILQSIVGFLMLANMKFAWYEALTLFALWLIQFIFPSTREEIITIYTIWILAILVEILLKRRDMNSFKKFKKLWKSHIRKKLLT